jgi:hypothetical protein
MGGVRSVGALLFLLRRRAVWVESGAHGGSHRGAGTTTPTFRVRMVWLHCRVLKPPLKNVASRRSARTKGRDMRVAERGANRQRFIDGKESIRCQIDDPLPSFWPKLADPSGAETD